MTALATRQSGAPPVGYRRIDPDPMFGTLPQVDTMEDELLTYELRADHVAILTMNRPHKMNALNAGLCGAIVEGLRRFQADPDAWVGILTGAGKAFAPAAIWKTCALAAPTAATGSAPSTT